MTHCDGRGVEITWDEINEDLQEFAEDYNEQEGSVVVNALVNGYFQDTL